VQRGSRNEPILDQLQLELRRGEHTAILGPNGAGKSSLIKLITHDYRPLASTEGPPTVEIFGKTRWDVLTLRRLLGVVSADLERDFVDRAMHASLSGMEMALSGFFSSRGVFRHHVVTPEMRERGEEALALMGVSALADRSIREMSTGELRRVLIARALAPDPPMLLLDEPTAGLDIVARHAFLETMRGLTHRDKTLVLVTHRIEEIIPEVSRVVLLRDGRIQHDGPIKEILTNRHLSDVFGAPLRVDTTAGGYYRAALRPR
jgi:iron complex transport system ATP-binding protein